MEPKSPPEAALLKKLSPNSEGKKGGAKVEAKAKAKAKGSPKGAPLGPNYISLYITYIIDSNRYISIYLSIL